MLYLVEGKFAVKLSKIDFLDDLPFYFEENLGISALPTNLETIFT